MVVDKFTKFVELFPLRVPTSKVILEWMLRISCCYMFPKSNSSDNGKVFVSNLWKAVLKYPGIKDRHPVPYRPAGRLVERHNTTPKQCLITYCHEHKDWDLRIPDTVYHLKCGPAKASQRGILQRSRTKDDSSGSQEDRAISTLKQPRAIILQHL